MLPLGYGSVVARVYNAKGDLVFDGVTRFRYIHTEIIDDASSITIETNDLTLADHADLQDGKELKLVWGYLPDNVRAHLVWIWDITPTFSETGLRLELECYCKAAYLKLNTTQKVWPQDTTVEDMVNDLSEQYGLAPQSVGLTPEEQSETPSQFEEVYTGGVTTSQQDVTTGQSTVARGTTAVPKTHVFKKHGEDNPVIQGNKSDRGILEDTVDQENTDNMFINGRDDRLIIQRRNLNQAPYKTYVFRNEPGYLISFSPATKNSKGEKGATANVVQGWAEETKEFVQAEVNRSHSAAGFLGEVFQPSTEDLVRAKLEAELNNDVDQPISVGGIAQEEYDYTDENGVKQYKRVFVTELDITKKAFFYIVKRGTRQSKLVFGKNGQFAYKSSAIDAVGGNELRGFVMKEPKEYLPTVENNPQDIAGKGLGRQSKQEMELYTADATVVGDPELQSSKVISILGVGAKYSGNYYIYHVSHDITPESGYICSLKMYRNGHNLLGSEIANKVGAGTMGIFRNQNVGKPGADGDETLVQVEVTQDGVLEGTFKKPKRKPKLKGL